MNVRFQEYFSRQISIPDVGTPGLEKLQSSRVAVVGVGGVGSSAAYYLAKSGVGQIRLIDQDIVETSNLHRILGAEFSDLYHPKAEVLAVRLSKLHPWCKTEPLAETLTPSNADQLLQKTDLVVDGLDNFRTRYVLNRFALQTGTPYLFTSSIGTQAHLALFNPPETACLDCAMPGVQDRLEESCETLGVTPVIVGLAGAVAAAVTVRRLLGQPTDLARGLLTIDLAGPDFLFSRLSKREECPVCGQLDDSNNERFRAPTMLCGGRAANVLPDEELHLDLVEAAENIRQEMLLTSTNTVLVFRKDDHIISLFRNGRILITGVDGEEQALMIAHRIWRELTDEIPVQY